MKTSDIQFEEVEAEVIEPSLAVRPQDFAIDPETVRKRIECVCEAATKALNSVDELAIDDDALSTLDGGVAKNFATSLNKDIKAVDEARKALKSECTQPVADMEAKLKALMKPVAELQARYKARQDEVEEQEKAAKMARLKAYYEDLAPFIALPLEGCNEALVPFERIADPKWRNKTAQEKKCEQELEQIVDGIAGKQKTLEGMGLAHREEAEAAFWATLSIESAIQRDQELTAQEERRAALEKAQRETKPEPQFEPEPEAQAVAEEPERTFTYVYTLRMTEEQNRQLIGALKRLDIHGTFKREQR